MDASSVRVPVEQSHRSGPNVRSSTNTRAYINSTGLELFPFGPNWESVPLSSTLFADPFLAELRGSNWRIGLLSKNKTEDRNSRSDGIAQARNFYAVRIPHLSQGLDSQV